MANKVTTLIDVNTQDELYPRTKTSAISDNNNVSILANVGTDTALASGDKIIFSDASNSGALARSSITFDGSTTTQFLSKKGTFESVLSVPMCLDYSNELFHYVSPNAGYTTAVTLTQDTMVKYNGWLYIMSGNSDVYAVNLSASLTCYEYMIFRKGTKLRVKSNWSNNPANFYGYALL